MSRKLKRLTFTVDVLFDDFVEKDHQAVLAKKIVDALRFETDSGDGLGDDNAIPVEIRAYSPEAGVASYTWENSQWVYNFIAR
jgi:hypothetical protein